MKPRPPLHAVADVSLARYDGTAGALVDTNIWIDCIDANSQWHEWAIEQLQIRSERAPLHVNLILTRDPSPYRSYFPRLVVVAP